MVSVSCGRWATVAHSRLVTRSGVLSDPKGTKTMPLLTVPPSHCATSVVREKLKKTDEVGAVKLVAAVAAGLKAPVLAQLAVASDQLVVLAYTPTGSLRPSIIPRRRLALTSLVPDGIDVKLNFIPLR